MSSDPMAAVIEAITRPDYDVSLPDEAGLHAIKKRVSGMVIPAQSSGPPSGVRVPLPELRALGAPRRLNWSELKAFPALVAEVRSNQRGWQVRTNQNRHFLLSNLDSGAVDVIAPVDQGRRLPIRPPSGSGAPPSQANGALSIIGVLPFDLLRWYSPQQLQGRLAITFFDYDMTTNTVRVDVGGGPGALPASVPRSTAPARPTTGTVDSSGQTVRWPREIRQGEVAAVHVDVTLPRDRVALIESPVGTEPGLAASLLMMPLDKNPVLMHVRASVKQGSGSVTAAFDVAFSSSYTRQMGAGDWVGYLVLGDMVIGPQPFSVSPP